MIEKLVLSSKNFFLYCSLSPLEDAASFKIFFTRIEGAPFIGAGTVYQLIKVAEIQLLVAQGAKNWS